MSTTYNFIALPSKVRIHYVDSGQPTAPVLLLLHGFPSSSNQFRKLIPKLNDKFRIIAPDLPGFGRTVVPNGTKLSFDFIGDNIGQLLDHLGISRFFVYVFDYGAPTAWRLALSRPQAIRGIIAQNGNAYEQGLSDWWAPLKEWWATDDHQAFREKLRGVLTIDLVKRQYVQGVSDQLIAGIDPNTWTFDYLDNIKGHEDDQLDLFYDYRKNLEIYPSIQAFFRDRQPPALIVWGKNDEIFPGEISGTAYKADLPNAEIHMIDGGHFLLETHLQEVTELIRDFVKRNCT